MTEEKLKEILALSPEEGIKALKKSSFNVPEWKDLEPQYDPLQHAILIDLTQYPPKLNDNKADDFKRTALALQKLAVNRLSQAMFSSAVKRTWNYDKDNESQTKAVAIIEELYRTQNYIDSENVERGKKNNAACEIVTIWSAYEGKLPNIVKEETTKFQLTHRTYSPFDGYTIYAQNDENGNLIVVSIAYKDQDDVEWFDIYTNEETPKFYRYKKGDTWKLDEDLKQNPKSLEVFPVVHTWLPEPVWGGEAGTGLVEQLEELESYEGMYIKKNSNPAFSVYYGEGELRVEPAEQSANDSRALIEVGKGGEVNDITWKGAVEATTNKYNRIRNSFFELIQVPDTSFSTMIASNTSAENKELVFSDVKAKALDLGGEWTKMFYEEIKIVIEFAKIMFPSLKTEFESLSARSIIQPYNLKSKKDSAEFVATGGQAMSLATQISELGLVDDIGQEEEAIQEEQGASNNQLL